MSNDEKRAWESPMSAYIFGILSKKEKEEALMKNIKRIADSLEKIADSLNVLHPKGVENGEG